MNDRSSLNPILLEVVRNRLVSITEEMGAVLMRSAYSPNIKERRDFSCALFDAEGNMLAQAAHIPVHLGSMPLSVEAVVERLDLAPGDVAVVNDPYQGGTHLPDITMVAPCYADEVLVGYVATRAHHADVGGMRAGSLPLSTSIFQEGIRIPPVLLARRGAVDPNILSLITANSRTPQERDGDLRAQIAASSIGVRRLQELLRSVGKEGFGSIATALLDRGELAMRQIIAAIPDGSYHFRDCLDDDGQGSRDISLDTIVEIAGEGARIDLRGSADQVPGCVNAVRAITLSAVYYVFRLLAPPGIIYNAGSFRPLEIVTRPGSVVDCLFPAAVAGGNVETSQRIVDLLLGALAQALPGRIPAASGGSMNNCMIGGERPKGGMFAYYETIACGAGGGPEGPGCSGVQTHMTNTLNTPVEAFEHAYPMRITRYELRTGSGGKGIHQGGEGIEREIELLVGAEVTILAERRSRRPYGLAGGGEGQPGESLLVRGETVLPLAGKVSLQGRSGDRVLIRTPGGGGWKKPGVE